ncbi:MAG: glycosyltransferase [Marinilabiliales bacterium]
MQIETDRKKKVLICPLNWGLGHASRLIPIIKELDKRGYKILIAGEGNSLKLLQNEFPAFYFFEFKGLKIKYSKILPLSVVILLKIPSVIFNIHRERIILNNMINEYLIDIVISDNRFGLRSKYAKCIYITHQIAVQMPGIFRPFQRLVYYIHKSIMKKFDECWIPDIEENPGIAGALSHYYKPPDNAKFIGVLSRFTDKNIEISSFEKYDILVILSGPEPQRTILEQKIVAQISQTNFKTLIVRGLIDNKQIFAPENIRFVPHLNTSEMIAAIKNAECVISRAGYSTIMDLLVLKKNAVLIPTPGQTEQEYLARFYHKRKIFFYMSQKKFDINIALNNIKEYNNIPEIPDQNFSFLDSDIFE